MKESAIGDKLENVLVFPSHLKTIDVDTGEVQVSAEPVILQSVALGSCVALVGYERKRRIGGIAHIMLPGKSPSPKENTKYAEDALRALFSSFERLEASLGNLEISVVGGANVLREGDIPDKVIASVLDYLKESRLKLRTMRVGGFERRSVFLDTTTGSVFYTEGNKSSRVLLKEIERI